MADLEKHIESNPDNPKNFMDKTDSDISGITIVLTHINESFDFFDIDDTSIPQLKKQRDSNLKFIRNLRKYLSVNDIFMTQEEYFQNYIELLKRLQDSTYPECFSEIKGGSYSSKLKYAIETYQKKLKVDSFAPNATNLEIQELYNLLDSLTERLDDKLQHQILRATFEHVLENDFLVNDCKIKGSFVKDVKKPHGFCAIYYLLEDANKKKFEVQLQSYMRYKNSRIDHSDYKKININHFFELADNTDNPELLEDYLSLLARTSKNQEKSLKQQLMHLQTEIKFQKNPEQKRRLENNIRLLNKKIQTIETAKSSIKLKDSITQDVDMIDMESTKRDGNFELKDFDGKTVKVYDTKTKKRSYSIPLKQALCMFAESVSPTSMNVIASAHTTFDSVANIDSKDLVERFTEVLRTNDELTYLSEILIDKLKEFLNVKNSHQLSKENLKNYFNKER